MDISFIVKNKKKIIVGVIILLILLIGQSLVNSTYSLFYHEDTAANTDAYSTGLLSIIASSKGENISLGNALPMSDSEGETTTPYTFTIKNIGNLDYKFDVKLLSTAGSDITIDSRYIKVKVDDGSPATLSSLSNSIIKSDITLASGESIDISIRVWLSIDTPNTQIGKVFNSKIVTDGQAVYTSSNNKPTAAATIVSLYRNATKTPVINNDITYQYDTTNNLMQDVGGNIRYYGAEPNNYIYFNCDDYSNQTSDTCEAWRIIGVFENKLKIVRNESIGDYSWDNKNTNTGAEKNQGKNNWSDATLMKILNPGYESETGGSLYWNRQSGECYSGPSYSGAVADTTQKVKNCDMSSVGLKNDTTRNMISETTYSLLGWNASSIYSNQIYGYERFTGNVYNETTRNKSWTGKVALPYPSDYGYAVDLGQCSKYLNGYNDSLCTSNNWMFYNVAYWLLTPNSVSSYSGWAVGLNGVSAGIGMVAYDGNGVRPTLFIKPELEIKDGDGSSLNPYQIKVS